MNIQHFKKTPTKILIFKLAAIGDVAMTCRAIAEWLDQYDVDAEIHWMIDRNLQGLASSLLPNTTVHWHLVDSKVLFQGSLLARVQQSLRMAKILTKIRPSYLILLHRDLRYKLLFRPFFAGSMLSIRRQSIHEIDACKETLRLLGAKKRENIEEQVNIEATSKSNKIGVLIGGAQNQKLLFQEKRWPHLKSFVRLLNEIDTKTIVLYGSREDKVIAEDIIENLPYPERVEDKVGQLPLDALPQSLAELDSFVSIDSGLAHIASMVMVAPHQKVITLFGPTSPAIWSPRAVGSAKVTVLYKAKQCSPCYTENGEFVSCPFLGDKFQHCMKDISIDEVIQLVAGETNSSLRGET